MDSQNRQKGFQRELWNENGYHIARHVLAPNKIEQNLNDVNTVFIQQLKYLGVEYAERGDIASIRANMEALFSLDLQRYLASLRLCAKLHSTYELILDSQMIHTVKQFGIELVAYQTQPVLHLMSEKLRIKNGYFGVGAHQDWPALQSGLDTVTSWIPMGPVRKNGLSMQIIPGSHRTGFLKSKQEEHIHKVDESLYSEEQFVTLEMNPGDVAFFSTFLIHRSELEGDQDSFRFSYSMRYENVRDSYFIRHSYPFAQKRVVEREVVAEAIPSQNEVRAVYS